MCSLMSAGEPTAPVLSTSEAPVLLGCSAFMVFSWLYVIRPKIGLVCNNQGKARDSSARREGLGDLLVRVERHRQRVQGLGLVDVDQNVVAAGQVGRDVVSQVLVLGVVDHADRP